MNRVLVIAEIGSCHDGSLMRACALVHAAKECGADIVKAQYWSSADRLADRRRVPPYYREIYRKYQMHRHWLDVLKAGADQEGLEFMCTTYLPEDVAVIAPYVNRFKVASFEAGDREFVAAHVEHDKPVIISTGMRGVDDMRALSDDCFELWPDGRWAAIREDRVTVMHCVSSYPCPIDQVNLNALRFLYLGIRTKHSGLAVRGFSDHTRHTLTGAVAVGAGAHVIEAHLRVETTLPSNPDYAAAFSPFEFAQYVENIRFAERAMGDGEKKLQVCEQEMAQYRVGVQSA